MYVHTFFPGSVQGPAKALLLNSVLIEGKESLIMQVKIWKLFRTKLAQQANGFVWIPLALTPMCITEVGIIPFSQLLLNGNWGIKKQASKSKNLKKFWNNIGWTGCKACKRSILNAPSSCLSIRWRGILFSHFLLYWSNKNGFPHMRVKCWNIFRTKLPQHTAQFECPGWERSTFLYVGK